MEEKSAARSHQKIADILRNTKKAYATHDYEKAKSFCEELLSYDKDNPSHHNQLGDIFFQMGQYNKALKCYEDANSLCIAAEKNTTQHLHRIGSVYYFLGEYEKTRECFEKILQQKNNDLDCLFSLGRTLNVMGFCAESKKIYQRILELGAKTPREEALVDLVYLEFENLREKKQDFSAAVYPPDSFEFFIHFGTLNLSKKNYSQAQIFFGRALEKNKFSTNAFLGQQSALQEKADLTALEAFSSTYPRFVCVHNILGMAWLNQKNLPKALTCFETVLLRYPKNLKALVGKGLALQGTGDKQDVLTAYICFYRAHLINPEESHIIRSLESQKKQLEEFQSFFWVAKRANAYFEEGFYEEALALYEIIVEKTPKNARYHYNKASVLETLGRHADALISLREAACLLNEDAPLAFQCGSKLFFKEGAEKEDQKKGLACLQIAQKQDDKNTEYAHYLGEAYFRSDRYLDALHCFRVAEKLDGRNKTFLIWQARALDKLGEYEESVRYFEDVLGAPDTDQEILGMMFFFYLDMANRLGEAEILSIKLQLIQKNILRISYKEHFLIRPTYFLLLMTELEKNPLLRNLKLPENAQNDVYLRLFARVLESNNQNLQRIQFGEKNLDISKSKYHKKIVACLHRNQLLAKNLITTEDFREIIFGRQAECKVYKFAVLPVTGRDGEQLRNCYLYIFSESSSRSVLFYIKNMEKQFLIPIKHAPQTLEKIMEGARYKHLSVAEIAELMIENYHAEEDVGCDFYVKSELELLLLDNSGERLRNCYIRLLTRSVSIDFVADSKDERNRNYYSSMLKKAANVSILFYNNNDGESALIPITNTHRLHEQLEQTIGVGESEDISAAEIGYFIRSNGGYHARRPIDHFYDGLSPRDLVLLLGKCKSTLTTLDLSEKQLTYKDWILYDQNLSDDDIQITYPNVTYLNLSGNNFGSAGIETLSRFLYGQKTLSFPALRHLNLSDNLITYRGLEIFLSANFFEKLGMLEHIDLSRNSIQMTEADESSFQARHGEIIKLNEKRIFNASMPLTIDFTGNMFRSCSPSCQLLENKKTPSDMLTSREKTDLEEEFSAPRDKEESKTTHSHFSVKNLTFFTFKPIHKIKSKIPGDVSEITSEMWSISYVAVKNPTIFEEHAMLYVHGLNRHGQIFLDRYHIATEALLGKAKIGYEQLTLFTLEQEKDKRIFVSWPVTREKFEKLVPYLRSKAEVPYCRIPSGQYDNCVRWCMKILKQLDVPVKDPESIFIRPSQVAQSQKETSLTVAPVESAESLTS